MALTPRALGLSGFALALLYGAAPAFAQDDAGPDGGVDGGDEDAGEDGGADPCFGACGPDLRCIEIDGEGYCGECGPGETQECEGCPGTEQDCGGDLYWEPCECPGCGDGPACGPGLECIDVDGTFYCGICSPGDARDCNTGCGDGVETCENDLFWGRCVPTDAVECVPGDSDPCESECGPGQRSCDASSCTWSPTCTPDALIQCLPGSTAPCTVIGACMGVQSCQNGCVWGDCVPPAGGCHECGDGVLDEDDGEACDDGNLTDDDGCSSQCAWEDARPFQSFECGTGPGLPGPMAVAGLAVAAIGLILRRRMR